MKKIIDPGKERRTINFIDNICFSHVTDLQGDPLDLYMSLMVQNGNSEMRLADGRDDEVSTGLQPLYVSEEFYDRIAKAGYEDRVDMVTLKNGGHGTREFFQPETKKLILDFFDRHLKKA